MGKYRTEEVIRGKFEIRPDGSIYILADEIKADRIIIPPAILDTMYEISQGKRNPKPSN